jgi:hypothetical protein
MGHRLATNVRLSVNDFHFRTTDVVVLQPFDTIGDRQKITVLSELTFVLVIQAQLVSFRWGLSTSCRSIGARSGG